MGDTHDTDSDPFGDEYILVSSAPPDFVCIDWTTDAAASLDFLKGAAPVHEAVGAVQRHLISCFASEEP
jgi:hypothetical protein